MKTLREEVQTYAGKSWGRGSVATAARFAKALQMLDTPARELRREVAQRDEDGVPDCNDERCAECLRLEGVIGATLAAVRERAGLNR